MSATAVEIDEDERFETNERRAELIGWTGLALLILLALAGLLGRGPLSNATAETDELKIDYHRFLRKGADAEFVVRIANSETGMYSFWINNELLENIQINRIEPEPKDVIARDEGVLYTFAASANATPDVTIHFEPQTFGSLEGKISDAKGNVANLDLLVYP